VIAVEDLEVYKRAEQLLFRVYKPIKNYPKYEKHRLSQITVILFIMCLAFMHLGNNVKSKRRVYLQTADAFLQMLKVCFRLARYEKYLGKEFHRQISLELTEIGKMLGGWIRS
jgi:hypothetical protein